MKKQVAEIFYTENLINLFPDDLPKLACCLFQVVFFPLGLVWLWMKKGLEAD